MSYSLRGLLLLFVVLSVGLWYWRQRTFEDRSAVKAKPPSEMDWLPSGRVWR